MLQAKQIFGLLGISDGSWKIMWLSISAECGTMSHKNTLRFVEYIFQNDDFVTTAALVQEVSITCSCVI